MKRRVVGWSRTSGTNRPLDATAHRDVLVALSGLLLASFVASMGNTIVSTALPEIARDLDAGQTAYGWVMTATLLSLTLTTPLWGALADRFDRKLLVQISLAGYTLGSMVAGLSSSIEMLLVCRVFMGVAVGGVVTLVQAILAELVPPREQGRYAGYLTAVFGAGTISGPLLGGLVTEAFGWRWCFYLGAPLALASLAVLQATLHLSAPAGSGRTLDWRAALLIGGGTRTVLGSRAARLGLVAGLAVGAVLFASTVYLSQYMQVARSYSPAASGLLTVPLVAGVVWASTAGGRRTTRTGHYRDQMLAGAALMTVGLALMGLAGASTNLVELAAFTTLIGVGVGVLLHALVVVVQNAAGDDAIGRAASLALFVRTLGGAIAVTALGALIASQTGPTLSAGAETADAIGLAFLVLSAAGVIATAAVWALPELPLRTRPHIDAASATYE
ncbi:MAG: MFS transporter [Baekduia sp.]